MEKEASGYKIIYFVVNAILSIILADLGIFVFSENKAIGIITILIAIILIYFSFHAFQISKNEKDIKEIKKEIETIKQNIDFNWKVLNSLTNNKLIDKINKILKNEQERIIR